MKLTALFLLLPMLHVYANGFGQEKFSLSLEQVEASRVFTQIQKESNYRFFYLKKDIQKLGRVNVHVKDATLPEIMQEVLGNALAYKLVNEYMVVISPSKAELEQQVEVRGRVTDENGSPLEGVSVKVKGKTIGVTTAADGSFSLAAENNDVLEITMVGYESRDIVVGGNANLGAIVMKVVSSGLEEVVVVGYGTQKKVNLTGSISIVSSMDLENRPLTNSSQALQGVQGIYVNQAGGARPGYDNGTIRIRGLGTIGSGAKLDPLVLVDGVEVSLNDIDPGDIDNISVLKDAASTAIYGSRAANGVVLVTTKSGKKDQRPTLSYNGYVGFQEATVLPDPVDNSATFMKLYNQAKINQGEPPYYEESLIKEFEENPTSVLYPNTNWMDVLFGKASIHEHNFGLTGGTQSTSYNLSAGYMDQEGILKGMSGAEKYHINLKIQSDISKKVKIIGGVLLNRWNIQETSEDIGTTMNRLMRMVPIQPIGRMENGDWPDSWVLTPGQNSYQNPLTLRDEGFGRTIRNRGVANLGVIYNISKYLKYQGNGYINYGNSLAERFEPVVWLHNVRTGVPTRNPYSSVGFRIQAQNNDQRLNFTHTVNYENSFDDKHNVLVLIGQSLEQYSTTIFQARRDGFENNNLNELNAGTSNQFSSGTSTVDRLSSFFGRVQYNFRDKYLFEVNGRWDGSSRFAPQNHWGFFPSLSAGWRISEERFMDQIGWLNELKLRGSWGRIGNQEIGRFQYVSAISSGQGYPFGGVYNGAGTAITQFRDPDLKWETTTMTNVGLDWTILNGKLSGEIEYFNKETKDILRVIPLPSQVGTLGGPTTNLATVNNRGIEIGLNYVQKLWRFLGINLGGQISYVKNKVISLETDRIISGATILEVGYPIDSWYVLQTDGIYQTQDEVDNSVTITNRVGPGDIRYVDRNKDGIISGDDRYIVGKSFPSLTYSFNFGLSYKSLSISTLWQGIGEIFVRPNLNMASPFNNGAGIQKEWLTDAWTPENPNARLPRVTARNQYTTENFSDSDFWLQNASYLRLKNIQILYNFNLNNNLGRLGISNLGVFLNAQNLWTITDVKYLDPERNITATNIDQYPNTKIFSFGLNVKF